MRLELVIRYIGYGATCHSCGRSRESTRYTLRQGEKLLQQFLLCDRCQDRGFVLKFDTPPARDFDPVRRRRIKISRQLERDVASDLGGKVQPGSGNKDDKSDIRVVGEWRIEHKYTDSVKSYLLHVADLAAVIRHANMSGEWPALVINFRKIGRKFITVPYEVFLEIVERLREKR